MHRIVPEDQSHISLSADGQWLYDGEPFQNEKIIEFFHQAIRRDPHGGYYLHSLCEGVEERVYFRAEDTAFFVREIDFDEASKTFFVLLNTGEREALDPRTIQERGDGVVTCRVLEDDRARLTPLALSQLADHAEMDGDEITIVKTGDRIVIGRLE